VLPPSVADLLIATAHNHSTVFTRWRQCAHPSNTWFLRPTPLTTQTAARSFQLFLCG